VGSGCVAIAVSPPTPARESGGNRSSGLLLASRLIRSKQKLDGISLSGHSLIDCIDLSLEVRYFVFLICDSFANSIYLFVQDGQSVIESVDAINKPPLRVANANNMASISCLLGLSNRSCSQFIPSHVTRLRSNEPFSDAFIISRNWGVPCTHPRFPQALSAFRRHFAHLVEGRRTGGNCDQTPAYPQTSIQSF
jgi:hypothetical protein